MFGYHLLVLRQHRRLAALISAAMIFSICIFLSPTSNASNPCPNTNAFSGITGLSLWLRADCVTGNAADPADNTTVNTWTDLSGLGNNATRQAGAPAYRSNATYLINSQPTVNFNGSSTFTSIDIRAITRPNISIFSVYKLRSNNQVGIWGVDDGGWDRFFMARWSGDDGIISSNTTTNVPLSGQNGVTKFITTIYKYNQNSGSSVYDNGALVSSFTDTAAESAAQSTLRIGSIGAIGSGFQLIGDIAELIIFDQALSDADRKTVNGYLNTKYNLGMSAGNIPVADAVFNSLTLGGIATYRQAVTITANVSVASKITFKSRNMVIPGCKNKLATGSGSSFSATCSWKPSTRGSTIITATAVPTSAGITSAVATPIKLTVSNRSGAR
jgi:hypothetical protein